MGKGPSALSCLHVCVIIFTSAEQSFTSHLKRSLPWDRLLNKGEIKLWYLVLNMTEGYPSLYAGYTSKMFSRVSCAVLCRQISRQCSDLMFFRVINKDHSIMRHGQSWSLHGLSISHYYSSLYVESAGTVHLKHILFYCWVTRPSLTVSV